jgi:integrase
MKMESVLKINQAGKYQYICVYYKQKNNRILVNTNVKPVEGKMNDDNWFKDNQRANGEIMQVKNNVDSYINQCRMRRKTVNHRECLEYLKEHYKADIRIREDKPIQKTILQYFSDFVNNKALELNHYNSQRVYNSLETNLKEFEKEYALTFESMNKLDFFYRFRDYSVKTLDHIDNTISKNVAILKSFLSYLQDNEIYSFKSALFNYSVGKTPAQVVTLTAEEIKQIYYCDKYDKFERQLIDVFVFLCVTSLRYSDYEEISKATIENNMLTKVNKKTKTDITIPLNKTALEILAKYDGNLPHYTNGYFNRELKEIFKRCKLLQTPYKKTSIQNKKDVVKEGMKYEFVTVHKSRASFITILIGSNTPLNEIMPITGHKLVSTLNAYTDKRINPDATNCITI